MSLLIHLVLFGQSDSRKSHLGNKLLEMSRSHHVPFRERGNEEGGTALGCQYQHADIEYNGRGLNLRIVDCPGIFQQDVTAAEKNWKDEVQAIYTSKEVDVFVIVLKAEEHKMSETVLESFVNFFGSSAALNTVVVFTGVDQNTTERKVHFHHYEYLYKHLKFGFPYLLWRDGETTNNIERFLDMILETKKLSSYKKNHFVEAQMTYTKVWINKMKKRLPKEKFSSIRNSTGLHEIGVPDILTAKFLSPHHVRELIEFANP